MSDPRPADCPRLRDGGDGPRVCPHWRTCTLHVLAPAPRGPAPSAARQREAQRRADDCSLDHIARAPEGMTVKAIADTMGVSRQAVQILLLRAVRKKRKAQRKAELLANIAAQRARPPQRRRS